MRPGVRIFEYEGPMMHAKCGTIDGVWSTIGSYNLDLRSMIHNLEVGIVSLSGISPSRPGRVRGGPDVCREDPSEEWIAGALVEHVLEGVIYLFRYWL